MSTHPRDTFLKREVDQRWKGFLTDLEQMIDQLHRVDEMEYMRSSNALKYSGEPLLLPEGADTTALPVTKDELIHRFTCEQCDTAMASLGIPLPPPDVSLADRRRLVGSALGVVC